MKGLLFLLKLEGLILQIENLIIAKEMWDASKTRNLGADCVMEERLQTLITEFKNLKMGDTRTIDNFVAKLSGIALNFVSLGEIITEKEYLRSIEYPFPYSPFFIINKRL